MKTKNKRTTPMFPTTDTFTRGDLLIVKHGSMSFYRSDFLVDLPEPGVTNPLEAHLEFLRRVRSEGPCRLVVDLTHLKATPEVHAIIDFDIQQLGEDGWRVDTITSPANSQVPIPFNHLRLWLRAFRELHPQFIEVGIAIVTMAGLLSLIAAKL